MSVNLLPIYLVLDEQIAVRGPQDSTPATPVFFERNTYRLQLHAQRRNTETGSLQRFIPADFAGYTGFEASLGFLDAKPTGGTWKIKRAGGSFSGDLAHDISAANLQTAIRALSGAGDVTVTNGNAENIYIIRPASAATDLTFEVELSLIPLCAARVRKASDGSGAYTVVKLSKAYFATTTEFSSPMPPETTVAVQAVGTTAKNTLQLITVPVGAVGSFRLQHSSIWTAPIEITGLTPDAVATALNALYSDGATSPRFAAYGTATGIQIECIGTLAKTSVPVFEIELLAQVALPIKEAWLGLTTLPLEMEVAAKTKVPMVFEVVGYDAAGREATLLQKTVDVNNVIHESEASETIASVATSYVQVTTTADPEAAIQVGLRSQTVVLTGSGSESTSGDYTQTFTHNLNTANPVFIGFRRSSVSPEKWQHLTDNEFTTETVSVNATSIFMPVIPPEAGNVGSVKFYAINPAAGVWTNDHEHTTEAINGTGEDDGLTLTQIIASLRAGMPTDWPSVPGNILVAGSVTADKLDFASLIAELFANTTFLTELRKLGLDETFIRNVVNRLTTSATLTDLRVSLFTSLLTEAKTTTTLQTALFEVLTVTEGFQSLLFSQVVAALAGGAQPPGYTFTMPDVDFVTPAPTSHTLGSGTIYEYRSLPICYQDGDTTDGGNISGTLPAAGTVAQRLTTTADTFAPECDGRPAQKFPSGVVIIWNGNFYQRSKKIGDAWYPVEMELPIFDRFLSDANFPASSLATINATVQLGLDSPEDSRIHARWRLALEVGTPTAESGELNLNAFTWASIGTYTMHLGPGQDTTGVQLQVTRPASGNLSFALKVNQRTITHSSPIVAGGPVAIRGRFTQFDTENNTAPRGAVRCKVVRPGGLVVATT